MSRDHDRAGPSRALRAERLSIGLLAFALVAVACRNDWRTDMWYQPAIQPQTAPPRPEPEDSVPLGAEPPIADRDDAESLKDPVPRDAASVRRGAAIFHERCICCHGAEGYGKGPVSRFFPPAPDLRFPAIVQRSDGYLFGTITFGGRAMPPYVDGLTRNDRWDIVNFVRTLQGRPLEGGR